MITMQNVLKRGRTAWDRSLMSEDEYVERVRETRAAMGAAGLEAVVAVGHTAHYGNLTWLSGNVPPLGWMAVVLGREAGPVLVTGGGSRDLPFLRTQTWIEDIRTSASLFAGPAEAVSAVIGEMVSDGASVGLVGAASELGPRVHGELIGALSAYAVSDRDDLLFDLRAVKRPRERVALERSLALARVAAGAAVDAWEDGASSSASLLAAERVARARGARDVRVLGNVDGEELAPVEERSSARRDRLVGVCAVESIGYWGTVAIDTAAPSVATAARSALAAMVGAAAPGVTGGAVAEAAADSLDGGSGDVAFAYGLGGGIGLDPDERPVVALGSSDVLVPGAVLALHVVTVSDGGSLSAAGETLRVEQDGIVLL